MEDVSFKLKTGEITALLGKNGAGKSTLLKILSGYADADSGVIFIDNLKIENLSLEECHAFLIGGITSLILRWIENDFQESPKNFGRKIFNFIEEIKLF